ncbi:unnamed protein product [Lymnaea stagnalis]|uniref:Fibropellin-1 n=1 Tax=Lymnaea stagnalis TaxID=6523 RepID=A0AAV2H768_LYMST
MWVGYWFVDQPVFQIGDCVSVVKDRKGVHKWKLGPCERKLPYLCQRNVCSEGSFHCINGQCINPSVQCDGFDDCGDGSEEIDCSSRCHFSQKISGPASVRYPLGGGNYPNNADCLWRFEGDLGYNIEVKVELLSLENEKDELILLDGGLTEGNSVELQRLTGQLSSPVLYYSSNNIMIVKFRSDGGGSSTGFTLSVNQVRNSDVLPTNKLTAGDTWKELAFPFYNSYQLGNQDYTYIIEAEKPGQIVTLEILDQDLAPDSRVIIRDGSDVLDSLLATLRGSYKGSSFAISTGRYMYVTLQTSRGSRNRGLKVQYKQGQLSSFCFIFFQRSKNFVCSTGYIYSNYTNGQTCRWNVIANVSVTVKIEKFNLVDSDQLKLYLLMYLSFQIYVAQNISSYPGTSLDRPIRVDNGLFSVTYLSSPTVKSKGFNITFSPDCPQLNFTTETTVSAPGGRTYGSQIDISCKPGSKFYQVEHAGKSTVQITCGAYGVWNVNTSPKCERVLCPRAPDLQNGYVNESTGNLAYGGRVHYKCYPGFVLQGSDTISCEVSGIWSTMPTCQAFLCNPQPTAPVNGALQYIGNNSTYGSIVRYSCNQGYDLIGETTQFCDSDGTWKGNVPTCQIRTCYTGNITNGVLSSNVAAVNQTVSLNCNSGYSASQMNAVMTCGLNGLFSPTMTCENINECDNKPCEHGCTDTPGSYRCDCRPGFILNGTRCTDIDECGQSPCNQICTNTPGSYTCSCSLGYALFTSNGIEGFSLPTSETGLLAGDTYRLNHTCVPVMCPPPSPVSNSDQLTQKNSFHYNDSVQYKCKLGFQLENSSANTWVCGPNKMWQGASISCLRATCPVDPLPGSLKNPAVISPAVSTISYGENITLACQISGAAVPSFTRVRRCTLIDGAYKLDGSINDYECGLITCGPPNDEPGSKYTNLTSYNYGDTFIFGCDGSFTLDGASRLTNNRTVTCTSQGRWDFGNLTCSGVQCTDPGRPNLGIQIQSDYRDGQTVIFNCTNPGYVLQPPYPISCRLDSMGKPQFNASVPRCVDNLPPVITNCPSSNLAIDSSQPLSSIAPKLTINDNGGIKSLSVSPAFPSSENFISQVGQSREFNYIVKDYAGNSAECKINFIGKDTIPPSVLCPVYYTYTFTSDTPSISLALNRGLLGLSDNITPRDKLQLSFNVANNYTFFPAFNLLQSFPPTHYITVQATVQDEAKNAATCSFGVIFTPEICSPYYIRKNLTGTNSTSCVFTGNGYDCTVTCLPGYRLYDNISQTSITLRCQGNGQPFLPEKEIKCVNLAQLDANYHIVYNFNYTGNNISNTCRNSYETIIRNTLQKLNDGKNLTDRCELSPILVTGTIDLGNLDIDEAQKKIMIQLVINFEKRSGANYLACFNYIKTLMDDPKSFLPTLNEFKPLQCESFVLNEKSLIYNGYYCSDSSSKIVSLTEAGTGTVGYCLGCLQGTYKSNGSCLPCPRGTYSTASNVAECTKCPNNTSTYSVGAFTDKECVPQCSSGSYSDTGLPPCNLCPVDTYSANPTTCLPCPANTVTRTPGTHTQSQCNVLCPPGKYNEVDGHETCKPCPKHTYTNKSGEKICTECGSMQYTVNEGSDSASNCLTLTDAQCISKCRNGVCSQIMPHIFSCVCNDGWTGENCDESFDPCGSFPCYNGGQCIRNASSYSCTCPKGTSGLFCENIIPTCTSSSCLNNGMCENLVNSFKCHCLPGFNGSSCEIAKNICDPNPCTNGGTCNSQGIRYYCTCPTYQTGINCEKSFDDCYSNPCRNSGTCIDGQNNFTCNCGTAQGYEGLYCEQRKILCSNVDCGPKAKCVEDETKNTYICVCDESTQYGNDSSIRNQTCVSKTLCDPNPCKNNAKCNSSGTSFSCACPLGYEGSMCQHNIDDCKGQPCSNGGKCNDGLNQFTCNCTDTGYTGQTCNVKITYCSSSPCSPNGTASCVDLVHGFQCNCVPGYTGVSCETNVNDCASRPCLHNGSCVDQVNDYSCACPAGWTGKDCSQEVNKCESQPCSNAAGCTQLFNDYFCRCNPNTYGKTCSSSTSVCSVANPCVQGACSEPSGAVQCSCPIDYTGDRCEQKKNLCSNETNICQNGGLCFPLLDSYKCECQPGYANPNCDININTCNVANCVATATCIDMEDKAYCRCPLDYERANCDEAWNQDFDLVFEEKHKIGMAYINYPIPLKGTALSVAVWVQFGERGGKGTFLSLFKVRTPNSLRDKTPLLWLDETSVYYYNDGNVVRIKHDINYNDDGKWHYLVVSVNLATGDLNFIVDTINSKTEKIGIGTLDVNLWLVLGSKYDSFNNRAINGEGFYGKLSRVTIYSRVLRHREEVTIVGNTNTSALFPDSILRWSSELKYSAGVRRLVPSLADKSCPFGYDNYPLCDKLLPGKNKVTITNGTSCQKDILMYSKDRLTKVTWPIPTFTGQASVKTSIEPGDIFVWGKYPVVIEASNADGNKALCLFHIYVQNDQCNNPDKPANVEELQCSPATYENYKQCGATCQNNTAPSIPSPLIHTCGPVGNWDPPNKYVPYRISPCGAITLPKHQLIINLRYSVPTTECGPAGNTLSSELLKTQVNNNLLNSIWDRVCTKTDCSDTLISVNCLNKRRKRQTSQTLNIEAILTLRDILDQVSLRNDSSQKTKTEDLYRSLLHQLTNNVFNYSNLISDASPNSFEVLVQPGCEPPKVLLNNQCVDCGPGTFYNTSSAECEFCPIGEYQPLSGQTSCKLCSAGSSTQSVGTADQSQCYPKCSPGQYFDTANKTCKNCSRGFYQPSSGQFYCLSCSADKTTKYTGTVLETDCSNDCPPGQEIGTSNNCTPCAIGFYRGENDNVCQRCPNAFVTQNMSSTSINDCNVADNGPGTYRDPSNPRLIRDCEIGFYQELRWQYSCISCGDNSSYRTETTRSMFNSDCKFYCQAGSQKKSGENACELCRLGFYRNGSLYFDQCDSCPSLFYTTRPGATSEANCTLYRCSQGQQPNSLGNGCVPCPKGTYQPNPDQPSCLPCMSGYSTRDTGAQNQSMCELYCNSGTYKDDKGSCIDCNIGYFKDNTIDVFSNCTRCLNPLYVTPTVASISNSNCTVLNCIEGYKTNKINQTCEPCPRGSYQDQKYQDTCKSCPADLSTRHTNSTSILDCESYCPSGYEKKLNNCSSCPRGYYKDNSLDLFMECTLCETEYVTPNISSISKSNCTVLNCSAGSFIDGSKCSKCPKGRYQDQPWQTSCLSCPPDRDTETEGSSNVTQCLLNCPIGTENNDGSDICVNCSIGYYKDKAGSTKCTACADLDANNITISLVEGAKDKKDCSTLVCKAGYYPSSNQCTACDYGYYQPLKWKDKCSQCDSLDTTYKQGSTNKSDCERKCSQGQELLGSICESCGIGFYNDKSDPSRKECYKCPDGFITAAKGTVDKSACNIKDCNMPGQYRDPSDNTCKACPVGSYQDTGRQDNCKKCPLGTTTRFEGSTNETYCKTDCPAGRALDESSGTCVSCLKGYYRPKSSWSCLPCDRDLTTPGPESDDDLDCSIATCAAGFMYSSDLRACIVCPLNSYQDLLGQRECKSCPENKATASTATSSADGCKYPCDVSTKCPITSQNCVNDFNMPDHYRCECKPEYANISGICKHKCDIPDYCGAKGTCVRSPFKCECSDGFTGAECLIRPNAETRSDNENQTILIAVVTTICGILFLILLIVCICVMARRKRPHHLSEFDERASIATRSLKAYDDYPTFAVNPAFSTKPPSITGGPLNTLPSHSLKMFNNATYNGDKDNDPAVYRA